jgi:hypothetical protein
MDTTMIASMLIYLGVAARRPLRHLAAYGSTKRYRPVSRSTASGSSGE